MKVNKILGTIPAALLFFSACDDNTSTLGVEVMPESDFIITRQENYPIQQFTSLKVDKILARTESVYLGKFTDPYTNTDFEADFLSQFYCPENLTLPDSLKPYFVCVNGKTIEENKANNITGEEGKIAAKAIELSLFYPSYVGDSLAQNTLAVYQLDKGKLDPEESYYTNFNPADFYTETAANRLATHSYTPIDQINGDSLFNANGLHMINIQLNKKVGNNILQNLDEHPEYFRNSTTFSDNVFPGVYVKNVQAEGSILNISYLYLNVYFEYAEVRKSTGVRDSLITLYTQFIATPEVIQQNRFEYSEDKLETLISQGNNAQEAVAYIQTPGGIFPEITLPIDEIVESMNSEETINSVMLTINRENNLSQSPYQTGTPSEILMVRKSEFDKFFEDQKVPDYKTSFIAYFSNNKYSFNNITALITHLKDLDEEEKNDDPDWNKILLVPITEVTQNINSTTTVVRVLHDLSMNFAKLRSSDVELRIIYSKYKDGQN